MMDLSSINAVVQRIADIEYKVGMQRPPQGGVGFQQALAEEMAKGKGPGAAPTMEKPAGAAVDAAPAKPAALVAAPAAPRDGAYFDTIRAVAEKYGVDPKLVSAVAEVESGFNQEALSSAGAIGIMQLMPDTAAALGVNPHDSKENIEGGVRYLRQLLDSFQGDVKRAVAAYNAGPQAVRDYGGVPPYSETQTYVDSVLDLYR